MGNYNNTAAAEFISELIDRYTTLAVALDQSGTDPVISVGAVAATTNIGFQVGIYDQRAGVDAGWDALPGFGTVTQPVYTGTVVKVIYELGAAPKAYYVEMQEIFKVASILARRGATVQLWELPNGNAPKLSNIGSASLKCEFNGNDFWPLSGRV